MKQKLLDGEKVYSASVEKLDIPLYLELRKHYDFIWFEMQHSTITYADVEAMIKAGSMTGEPGAIPCVRMHSPATEHVFQQCGDIGALIFVVPTVDTVEQASEAAKWARFPPVARRSTGGGQHARVWGEASNGTYMDTYNDNCLLVVMVETAVGCANAYDIARVPGVGERICDCHFLLTVCSRFGCLLLAFWLRLLSRLSLTFGGNSQTLSSRATMTCSASPACRCVGSLAGHFCVAHCFFGLNFGRICGEQAGDPLYDKMVDDVCKDTKRAGKIFGTTMPTQAEGEAFSSDAQFFYTGPSHDGWERSDYVDPYKDAKKK